MRCGAACPTGASAAAGLTGRWTVRAGLRPSAPRAIVLPNEGQAGAAVRVGHDVLERLQEVVDLLKPGDERREQLHDVDVVGRDLSQYPVPVEQRNDDKLREHAGAGRRSTARNRRLADLDSGSPNSGVTIRPSPRTSLISSYRSAIDFRPSLRASPVRCARAAHVLVVESRQCRQARHHG